MQSKHAIEENEEFLPQEDMNTNEASPNFLQKKVEKILSKLQFISNVFNTNNNNNNNEITEMPNTEVITSDIMEITEETVTTISDENKEDVEEISEETLQKAIYPKSSNEPPIRFTLDIKDVTEENNITTNEINNEKQTNRFGQVGVFFAEILGSIVALAYGAALQLNQITQGTTTSPPL